MEKFDQSLLKNIYKESVGTEPSDKELEKVERSLKVVFIRPGEALCPHCFIKRLTYMICLKRLREDFKLSSTDDVALAILDERGYRFLAELDKTRDIVKKRLEENSFLARILIATSGKLDGGSGAAGEERFLGRDILEACKNDLDRCRKIFNDLAREVVKSIANEKEDIRRKYVRELSKELFKEYMNSGIINDHSDIIDLYRLDRIPSILGLRTSYAIVKGDADNIGKILGGGLPWIAAGAKTYDKLLLDEMRGNLKGESDPGVFEEIEKAFESMLEIIKAVDKEATIMISPTFSVLLSISLMISALKQASEILSMGASLSILEVMTY